MGYTHSWKKEGNEHKRATTEDGYHIYESIPGYVLHIRRIEPALMNRLTFLDILDVEKEKAESVLNNKLLDMGYEDLINYNDIYEGGTESCVCDGCATWYRRTEYKNDPNGGITVLSYCHPEEARRVLNEQDA